MGAYSLVLQMSMGMLSGLRHRGHIIPQPKTVELVVLECGIRLRYQPVEVAVVCSQVNQNLQRNVVLSRRVRGGR